ncbi:ABC transporter ATP-binding protein [Streptomyces antarcticus]|uniref:ABC transporter ATP-binding protein n=1 Tax=Streptomyces antarcticus TaxID=2996458 RepID=UPI00226E7D3E|nr:MULTISPECIES: ATP-binding cassette domain-containing protein [unclassified Streptomyces]MCY0941137.1 ATP-binding cassette domain-containing protein [Streptomyces sp. H34-AA3]MCZ4084214.1 ATP-binding cassette domain-containing protein [Streptomyces sp. H34-S5]
MTVLVDVRDLRIETGGRAVVDGVSLTVRAGRVTALVGPSGSGKTTTGLALLGEYPPGARVTGTVRTLPNGVGYVPQHPAAVLHPARRVGALLRDVAARGGGGRRAVRERVHAALLRAQLPDPAQVLRRFPHQLSGGQQQRVVLAQALLFGAGVIVADEPTTGQDPHTKRGVVRELAALAQQGVAIVLLSHDLDVVRELADEVVVLRAGRVVDRGPADTVLGAPPAEAPPSLPSPPSPPSPSPQSPSSAQPFTAPPRPSGRPSERAAGPPRLEVRDLTAVHRTGRGALPVLHGVGVSVSAGECLALIGRSGSGKTTLGRCVAGLHAGYRGGVVLDGVPLPPGLRSRSRAQLASVQYVFQDAKAAFDEHRPVLGQIARTAVRLRGADRADALAQARRTVEALGLPAGSAGRRPGELSGGELQRAALARALLARPRVLVCDEITSGLDPAARGAVLDLLAGLRERDGLALVFITHDLAAADALGDRTAVMDAGRVVRQGPARPAAEPAPGR